MKKPFENEFVEGSSFEAFMQSMWGDHNLRDYSMTGSRVICDPPVLDTDVDYLILVHDLDTAGCWLQQHDWRNCFEDWKERDTDRGEQVDTYTVELEGGAHFQAWRRGEVNVIVTNDVTLYVRSRAATALARELNLKNKVDRIALFRCIKFGEPLDTGMLK